MIINLTHTSWYNENKRSHRILANTVGYTSAVLSMPVVFAGAIIDNVRNHRSI